MDAYLPGKLRKSLNLSLLAQSLVFSYLVFLMLHPSLKALRIAGFILGLLVFYISWSVLPLLAKRKIDSNKFSLLFLLSLFFPYYLLRDYHFIILAFAAYYFLVCIYSRHTGLSESMIILFLIISLSFSVLHINMNHEDPKTRLEKSIGRTAEGPVKYRILVPELINLSAWITGLDNIFGLMVIFRFASLGLVFFSTYLLVRLFSNNHYLALFMPLLYIFMVPFSWDVLYVTDFPEIFLGTLFIYSMFRKKYALSFIFFILGALNRDTIIFNLAFFVFYSLLKDKNPIRNIGRTIAKNRKLFLIILLMLAVSIMLKFAIISLYGKTWMMERQLAANLYSIKDYISRFERFNFQDYNSGTNRFFAFLTFSGGLYAAVIIFYRKVPMPFLLSFLLAFVLFIPLYFYIGTINETRILYVFYPYMIICLAYILKGSFKQQNSA
ncbi:hypothetical protein HYS31_02305 [Candidatus Woesearchaeota archaeon]|nr:hypothetical protein [Candidatus Woesearchaeota archaeon]